MPDRRADASTTDPWDRARQPDGPSRPFGVVVVDLDGTLLTSAGEVSAATRDALVHLAACEVQVIAATARAPRGVYGPLPEIGWAVCCNGAIVYDVSRRRIVWERTFEPDTALALVDAIRLTVPDVGFAARCGDRLLCDRRYAEERPGPLPNGSRIVEEVGELAGSRIHALAFRKAGLRATDLVSAAGDAFAGRGDPTRSTSRVLDVVPPGVSKTVALEVLSRRQGWSPSEAVAFGDMPNDLEMLEWAGSAVAVADAHPDVKAAADLVTASNDDDDGVVVALRHLGMLAAG